MQTCAVFEKLLSPGTRCIALLILCQLGYGQVNQRSRPQAGDSSGNRRVELSDLAQDNFNRVAASSVQIREVLFQVRAF